MLKIASQIKSPIQYVPLKHVDIQSTVRSFAADVTITQIFRNDQHITLEAVYCFPIEEQAAVYSFTARIDNREIVAQLRDKKEVQVESDHASQRGYSTYLLEQDEKCQDYFLIDLGALPPSKECMIIISYVTELDLIRGSIIRFVIPTTIAPRYSLQKKGLLSQRKYVQANPYTIEYRCCVEKIYASDEQQQQCISRIHSPSHRVEIDLSAEDVFAVTFIQTNSYLDRDILLDIQLSDKRANTFVVVEANAAMAAVTPFEEDCYLTLDHHQINEFVFILDCSRSMRNDNRIGLAREAMLLFLQNLPQSCYFNIIKFGAKYESLFNETTALYTPVNIRIAERFISQIQADLGGTEILAPLQWLQRHPPRSDCARQVFLLTDGEVSNVSEVLELCRSMATSTRIFSFGLGPTPSRSLIKGLARTTNGRFVFIPPNTYIDVYVGEQLQKAVRRCITNIRVQWNLELNVQNVPHQLPPAYLDDRLIIYALTKDKQTIALNDKSSIELRTDHSYYRLGISHSDRITTSNQMIARLAAKALILELEHSKIPSVPHNLTNKEIIHLKEERQKRIIALSLRYNILSPYTTFVGIEKRLNEQNFDVYRAIPIQIYADHSFLPHTHPNVIINDRRPNHIERTRQTSGSESDGYPYQQRYHNTSPRPTNGQYHHQRDQPRVEHDVHIYQNEMRWTNDKSIVEYLINIQASDGLWNFESNPRKIKELTGKSLDIFQSSDTRGDIAMLVTAIISVLLEVRFMPLQSVWEESAERARRRLLYLLHDDWKKLVILFRNIRIILNG